MLIFELLNDYINIENTRSAMKKLLRVALLISVVLVVLVSSPTIFGLLSNSVTVPSHGNVKTIGVTAYWDSVYTSRVTSIDWGTIEPGSSKNVSMYLRNEGNAPITVSLNVMNWNPTNASSYMSVSWNYSGAQISPSNSALVTLKLVVASNVSNIPTFDVSIVITGTG
jgi:hypothetical protein